MSSNNTVLRSPTISICAMVGNEDNQIDDFIFSLLDFADEIIFVTSPNSSRKTIEIIEKYKAQNKISIKTYIYDVGPYFHSGKARNLSLEKATKEYIVVLDIDERMSTEFKRTIRSYLLENNPPILKIVRIDDLLTHLVEFIDRIIKNDKKIWYGTNLESQIHEYPIHSYNSKIFPEPIWHSQKEMHWLQAPQRILPSVIVDTYRTPKTKSFFGHLLRGLWLFQFKFKKIYFSYYTRRDGKNGFKYACMRAFHALLIQLLVGFKPHEGYKYWEDPQHEKHLKKARNEIIKSLSVK